MCNKLILDQYKTFLLELNTTELVQTAFQTIYEHLQHEADCLGRLEGCTILLCLLVESGNRLKLSRQRLIYMLSQKVTLQQKCIATRIRLIKILVGPL